MKDTLKMDYLMAMVSRKKVILWRQLHLFILENGLPVSNKAME